MIKSQGLVWNTRTWQKIVNYATIKETEKLKETMVGSKWNWWVATNIYLDHINNISILQPQMKYYED